jgi:hypothetical protein
MAQVVFLSSLYVGITTSTVSVFSLKAILSMIWLGSFTSILN